MALLRLRKVSQAGGQKLAWQSEITCFSNVFLPGTHVALTDNERLTAMGDIMKRINTIIIGIASLLLFSLALFGVVRAQDEVKPSDPDAYYKAKCVACHGQKAEKKFDPSLTDEQYVETILKGKKPEKPPNMPAYGEKGVTTEQAKALLDHMKHLRTPQ